GDRRHDDGGGAKHRKNNALDEQEIPTVAKRGQRPALQTIDVRRISHHGTPPSGTRQRPSDFSIPSLGEGQSNTRRDRRQASFVPEIALSPALRQLQVPTLPAADDLH